MRLWLYRLDRVHPTGARSKYHPCAWFWPSSPIAGPVISARAGLQRYGSETGWRGRETPDRVFAEQDCSGEFAR
jgi:hypothetical protein